MGLDVELFLLGRRTVELTVVADTRSRFAAAVGRAQEHGSAPTLDRADLYGVVELSSDEMPQFLTELSGLLAAAEDPRDREVLRAVRGLGERCRDDRATGLRLVGD